MNGSACSYPASVDFHFDILCPFAYHASRWIREVREVSNLQVNWRFFSLEEVNRRQGKKHPWERDWSFGWSQLRIAALLRRLDPDLVDKWYEHVGRALHLEGRQPHKPEVARALLAEIGVSPTVVDAALADPSTHDSVLADHQRVVAAGGFGVPTLFFPDGQCLFGPVLVEPPTGARALQLWELLLHHLDFPEVYEINHPRGLTEQQSIATVLEPYLQARDWVSINRGEIVNFTSATMPVEACTQ